MVIMKRVHVMATVIILHEKTSLHFFSPRNFYTKKLQNWIKAPNIRDPDQFWIWCPPENFLVTIINLFAAELFELLP